MKKTRKIDSTKKSISIPVFLPADNNYAPYMAALMVSIMDNTDADIDFYVIDGGINPWTKKQISTLQKHWEFGLEYINVEPWRELYTLPATPSGHVTRSSSDRFLIPYIKPDMDKAIILDVDMIALGDIRRLWEVDLEGMVLASVPVYCWESMEKVHDFAKQVGMSENHIYTNMGAMLVDLKMWRDEDLTKKFSEYEIRFDTKKINWWEEVVLNLLLQDNQYKILDPKFNMMIPLLTYFQCGKPEVHRELIENYAGLSPDYKIDEIIFTHYAMAHTKPWNTRVFRYRSAGVTVEIPYFKAFWHYLKQTPFYDSEIVSFLDRSVRDNASSLDRRIGVTEAEIKKTVRNDASSLDKRVGAAEAEIKRAVHDSASALDRKMDAAVTEAKRTVHDCTSSLDKRIDSVEAEIKRTVRDSTSALDKRIGAAEAEIKRYSPLSTWYNYQRCRVLSHICFGKTRKHYIQKKAKYRKALFQH